MRSWNTYFNKIVFLRLWVLRILWWIWEYYEKFWWSSENSDDHQTNLMIVRKFWWSSENSDDRQKILIIARIFWWSSENSDDRQKILMIVRKFWWSSENSEDRQKILMIVRKFWYLPGRNLQYVFFLKNVSQLMYNSKIFTHMKVVHLFAHAFLDHIKGTGPLISQCYWCLLVSFWHSDNSNFCRWQITEEKSQKNEEL